MANSFLKKTCLPRSYSHTVVRLPVIRLPMRPIGALLGSTRRVLLGSTRRVLLGSTRRVLRVLLGSTRRVLRVLREHRLQGAHKAHL